MNIQLDFESLFKQALTEWPKELDLSELQQAAPELSRYAVKGLGIISDEIEEQYIGQNAEVIMRTLHSAMYAVIHATAKTVLKVELSSIRPEAVRLIFEKKLKAAAAASDLNWSAEDYALVESYFTQNSSS